MIGFVAWLKSNNIGRQIYPLYTVTVPFYVCTLYARIRVCNFFYVSILSSLLSSLPSPSPPSSLSFTLLSSFFFLFFSSFFLFLFYLSFCFLMYVRTRLLRAGKVLTLKSRSAKVINLRQLRYILYTIITFIII